MHDRQSESFESQLASAFDRMSPSEDAQRRMLAALQAADDRRAPKRRATRKLAVAVAACLALLAGVGALALNANLDTLNEDAGSQAASSMENLASPLSADRASSESAAVPAPDGDARYPFVTLASGEQLRVALDDDGPLTADPAALGDVIEQTVATAPNDSASTPCTVFESGDDAHPFAIRFDESGAVYLADPIPS